MLQLHLGQCLRCRGLVKLGPKIMEKRRTKVAPDFGKPVFAVPSLSDRERIAHVWEMRLTGKSHELIALEMATRFPPELLPKGWSAKHVFADCQAALNLVSNEYVENSLEMVQLEMARFDKMQAAIWQKAEEGDIKAVEAVLAISRERRKMLGLDSPEKFVVDYRVQLLHLLQAGTVTPAQIVEEFGESVLIEVNQISESGKYA